jgi:hypothetical protein
MARARAKQIVTIEYNAQTRQAIGEIRRLTGQSVTMQREMSGHLRSLATGWRGFGLAMQGVREALGLVTGAWRVLSGAIGGVAAESQAQAEGVRRLGQSLARHGLDLAQYRERIESVAASQQRWTAFGDDATRATLAALADATRGLALEYADLERGMLVLQDVQADTGQSADALAASVAKAAAGQTTALARMLPAYRSQLAAIGDLSDAGERYRATLGVLEEAYGGQARAIGSLELQQARLRNGLGDVREALGDLINGALQSSGVLGTMADATDSLAAQIADADSAVGGFVRDGLGAVLAVAGAVVQALGRVAQGMTLLRDAARVGSEALTGVLLGAERNIVLNRLRAEANDIAVEIQRAQRAIAGAAHLDETVRASVVASQEALIEDLRAAHARVETELRQTRDAWASVTDAQAADVGSQIDALVRNAQVWETSLEGVADMMSRVREGLRSSFELGGSAGRALSAGGADGGGPGAALAQAGGSGAVAGARLAAERDWWAGILEVHRWGFGELLALAEHWGGLVLDHAAGAAEKRLEIIRREADAASQIWQAQSDALDQIWQVALGSMSSGLVRLVGDADASFGQIAQSMLSSIGSTMQQISIAMIAGGTASGPFGAPMLLFGIGAQVAAALFGRGGGGRGARAANAAAGVRAPLERGRPQQNVTYVVQAGIAVATEEQLRRTVTSLVRTSQELGE